MEAAAIRKRWTLVAVVVGSAIVFLESSIVAAALPKIGEALDSTLFGTLEAQSYVYYGYLLALSSLLIVAGALTDYRGRKRMFVAGLIGFGITSTLCGVATNMELLVAARVLQGAAGALLVPGSLSIITATFEGEEQARAFGVWAGASAATTILGPVIGGALVAYVSWRAAFLINVPLAAFAAWASIRFMAESRDEEATGELDWVGAILIATAIGGLTFGAIRGESQGWGNATPWISLGIGAAAAVAFPLLMARSSHPLVPLELFRSRNFSVTNVSTLLIYGAIYVMIQFTALFTIGVLGYNEVGFGLATIPSSLFLALFSARFGALAGRFGPRAFMAAGPAIMGIGLLWLSRVPEGSTPWVVELERPTTLLPPRDYVIDLLPAMILFGIGLMIMVAPLTTALMRSVPVRHSGIASAFNNAISRVGPQLAGALIFVVISATFYATLSEQVAPTSPAGTIQAEVSPLNPPPEEAPAALARAVDRASTAAFHSAMLIAAVMCLVGAAVNALGIKNDAARDRGSATEATASTGPHALAIEEVR